MNLTSSRMGRKHVCWFASPEYVQVQATGDMDGNFQMGAFLTFLSSYKLSDSLLSISGGKRKALTLYRAFIDGPNFVPWMNCVLSGG